jgi:signal transduction histidine kinase
VKLRIASIAFLIAATATGLAWITLQPTLLWLLGMIRHLSPQPGALEASLRLHRGLPLALALDLSLASLVTFAVLHLALGRPLRRVEQTVEQMGRLDLELPVDSQVGPLLSRLDGALHRMASALREEKQVGARQLAELRATNDRLGRLQAELIASERLATVGKLAAGVAHEIGNPLSGILGYLSLARARAVDPETKDYLARIDTEVQRIDEIVRGLLDLGRTPKGTPAPVDVEQIAKTCAGLLGAGPELAQVSLELDFEPGTLARAEAGPLSQVFLNLLLNAAQALEGRSGRIQIRGRTSGEEVRVEVEDSGPGISPAVMPRLFEPFFTTKFDRSGTGLGLAISYHLVTQMGGQLSAANAPGGGALFTLVVPRA